MDYTKPCNGARCDMRERDRRRIESSFLQLTNSLSPPDSSVSSTRQHWIFSYFRRTRDDSISTLSARHWPYKLDDWKARSHCVDGERGEESRQSKLDTCPLPDIFTIFSKQILEYVLLTWKSIVHQPLFLFPHTRRIVHSSTLSCIPNTHSPLAFMDSLILLRFYTSWGI